MAFELLPPKVNRGKKNDVEGALGTQSTLKLLPVKGTFSHDNALTSGSTSRTVTATSSNVTTTSVMAGSDTFNAHMKSVAGLTRPRGSFMVGKFQEDKLSVALAERTTEFGSVYGFLVSVTSTFMYEYAEPFTRPATSRMPMPPSTNSLSGKTRAGGLAKSNVKHVSRRNEAKDRGGQGVQVMSTLLGL